MPMDIKMPPSDGDAEKSLLWAAIIDEDVAYDLFTTVQIEWFYEHKELAEAVFELGFAWQKLDLISLKNSLEKQKKLEKLWWLSALIEFTENAVSYNWQQYANIIEEKWKQRALLKEGYALINWVENDYTTVAEKAMVNINKIMLEGWKKWIEELESSVRLTEEYIELNKTKSDQLLWWSWGNDWLDKNTRWIRASKTYRIGAPSGLGKTNQTYQTIIALLEQGAKVFFASLENSIETTIIKLMSSKQEVNPNEIESWAVPLDKEWLLKHRDRLVITDQLFDLWEIKRQVLKEKPDVVFLDYIGLVNIKGCDEKSLYNSYADDVKKFVQQNKWVSWVDLSNLNKDDDEEKIRRERGFNWAAKLRNNTDVAIHMFYYKPFYEYKEHSLSIATEEAREHWKWAQCITFLISKNRLWPDWIEEQFLIKFNEGIKYKAVSQEQKEKWKF